MVDTGTKQSKFYWTFWYQIRKIVFFALGRVCFWSHQVIDDRRQTDATL